jgi:ubiquinone biosynthesis protein
MLAANSAQVHLNALGNIAVLVTGVLLVLGLGWAARRLLGLPVGALRALVAGLIGAGVAQGLGSGLRTTQRGHAALSFTALLGVPVIVAMIFIVVSEALVPSGSMPGALEMARTLRRRITRARRYSQITRIAVRHGLGPYLRGRRLRREDAGAARTALAASLRQALEEAGPTFVKLGQLLSTRRDLLPAEFTGELARLQDRAAAAPWAQVAAVLTESLGAPPTEVFCEFAREPVAAASIAQVHRARLRPPGPPGPDSIAGGEVAVKVLRPGIQASAERDLDIVQRLAVTLEQRTGWARRLGTVRLAEGFAAALREELDFRVEARNMTAAAASWSQGQPGGVPVVLPGAHLALSSRQVLVTDWLDGVSLAAAQPLIAERGLDRAELARTLLWHVLHQITVDGVFHADPHPGNILLLADGRLGLLDLGSVGRLDALLRSALQDLLLAAGRGDPGDMSDALLDLVSRPDEIDEQALERALGQFMALHLAGGAAGAEMFTDLFRLVTRFGLGIPPEVAAVFRALATLEGTLTQLAPGFDLVAEAQGFAQGFFAERLAPDQLRKTATDELVALLPVLRRLPRRIDWVSGALEEGRLGINVRLFADRRDRAVITGLVHQALLTLLGAVTGVIARDPARFARRPAGDSGHQPVPADRLQPARRRGRARAARAVYDLPGRPPVTAKQPGAAAVSWPPNRAGNLRGPAITAPTGPGRMTAAPAWRAPVVGKPGWRRGVIRDSALAEGGGASRRRGRCGHAWLAPRW